MVHLVHLVGKVFKNGQVTCSLLAFIRHHANQRFVPLPHVALHPVRHIKLADQGLFDAVQVHLVGPDHILNLVHVKQVFCNILFSFLLGYNHCYSLFNIHMQISTQSLPYYSHKRGKPYITGIVFNSADI